MAGTPGEVANGRAGKGRVKHHVKDREKTRRDPLWCGY